MITYRRISRIAPGGTLRRAYLWYLLLVLDNLNISPCGAPFNYSVSAIGSFGLVAIGGALVAPYFGKLADKGNPYTSLLITVGLIIGSIVLIKLFPHSLPVLVFAIFFLDIGVQATQITNCTRIYSLHEDAHSRLNTVYLTTYFIGAAIGTHFGLLSWKLGGWNLSTWQMLLWGIGALAVVVLAERVNAKHRKRGSENIAIGEVVENE